MALSQDLISQFTKLTSAPKEETSASVKGTVKIIDNITYVRLDGSNVFTPVDLSVEVAEDERVKVLIKDHMATVVENITSPAARNTSVEDLKDTVDEQGNTIQQMDNTIIQQGNSIIQMDSTINQQGVTINQHDTIINQQGDEIVSLNNTIIQQGNTISSMNNTIIQQGDNIDSMNNTIIQQGNTINSMNNTITQHDNDITSINNTIIQHGNQITQHGDNIVSINNTITSMDNTIIQQGNNITSIGNTVITQGNNITILNSGFEIKDGVLTGLSEIIVTDLTTNKLKTVYAEIDFANIEMAAVEKLFAESGIIKDLIVESGQITGELIGVTIKGDLIEGNTIVADKLVVLGDDGLYYKLNINGENVESEQTEYNSLNGSIITAKSITANKITVTDLVAFGATIGGFVISDTAIYSLLKDSEHSLAPGLYIDKNGQLNLGDDKNYIKYYINDAEERILDIKAQEIKLGVSNSIINEDTVSTIINTEYKVDHISNIFQITGGTNLLKNSVWYYLNAGLPLNWNILVNEIAFGGQDDSLIGESISRGKITLGNSIIETDRNNLTNLTLNKPAGFRCYIKNDDNTICKIGLYSGVDTSGTPIWEEITNNTNNEWVKIDKTFTIRSTDYILKIESSSSSNGKSSITDTMINYGEPKSWELSSGEIFGSTIKLNSQGIQVTSDTANTETYMTTNGVNVFNRNTKEKITDLTDNGINTKNVNVSNNIQQKRLVMSHINNNGPNIYDKNTMDINQTWPDVIQGKLWYSLKARCVFVPIEHYRTYYIKRFSIPNVLESKIKFVTVFTKNSPANDVNIFHYQDHGNNTNEAYVYNTEYDYLLVWLYIDSSDTFDDSVINEIVKNTIICENKEIYIEYIMDESGGLL